MAAANKTPFRQAMDRIKAAAPLWRCTLCGALMKPVVIFDVTGGSGARWCLPDGWQIVKGGAVCRDHPETKKERARIERAMKARIR